MSAEAVLAVWVIVVGVAVVAALSIASAVLQRWVDAQDDADRRAVRGLSPELADLAEERHPR